MDGPALTDAQREALALFQEVTAGARDDTASAQILKSCGWNVEQALQLHLAAHDEDPAPGGAAAMPAAAPQGGLAEPLLGGGGGGADVRDASAGATAAAASGPAGSFVSWVSRGVRSIGAMILRILSTFLFGPGGMMLGGGTTSGAAFGRSLTASYGAELQLPSFFEGSFSRALQSAQSELKLLVVFLHSEYAREARSFCTNVLCNDIVRGMLDENFLLWGGDTSRMEAHTVSQMIHSRRYPCFAVLLPTSLDEVRVIGMVQGEVDVDAVIALLMRCSEEMETHRSEMVARSAQHIEDRSLREEQDREYQEALEMDRKRAEQQREQEEQAREAQRLQEEKERKEREELERTEAAKRALEEERTAKAQNLEPEGPDATAKVALRLPAGQRAQRKFRPEAKLSDLYDWAGCVGYLPENEGRGLEIPGRFMLKTSFPTRDLTEMDKTIKELELSGTNLVLAEIDDDDDHEQ